MLLFYCENISPRIEYIARFMLEDICGFEIKIICDEAEYLSFPGPSLNYSNRPFNKKEIQINPAFLLFEDSLTPVNPRIEKKRSEIKFYLPGKNSDQWVNDPFAASFFLVSRYEEYFPFTPSEFNSYEANVSISFQQKLLNRPLVNEWGEKLKKQILDTYPSMPYRANQFYPVISIDIDQAYAFKYRGWLRNILSLIRNIVFLKRKLLWAQLKTIFFTQKDPYDTYEYLKKMQFDSKLPFIYFVNLGAYSRFDKNLDAANPVMKKLLNDINSYAPVGIHPSYFSNEKPEKFAAEKKSLEALLGKSITKSRQHYLKIKMPDTYQHLLNAGIKEDYSMGYGKQPGFRAGTCTPFNWFDLTKNTVTPLKIYPITFMEGTFGEDLNSNPDKGFEIMTEYIKTVRSFNGYFLCIWHNNTVSGKLFWKKWKKVFEELLLLLKVQSGH
ncbi:MAG TPA: polysaccharide deacetylase family protein [Chitinophagaceae bacterium]|nr:polysaccharide deacetylase family protein [Chitinophagaceae bacterium]